jgi:hypothetical protein
MIALGSAPVVGHLSDSISPSIVRHKQAVIRRDERRGPEACVLTFSGIPGPLAAPMHPLEVAGEPPHGTGHERSAESSVRRCLS